MLRRGVTLNELRRISCRCYCAAAAEPVKLAYSIFEGKGTAGDAAPLVILHGLFGQRSNWTSISKFLATKLKNRVITVDLRNHGESAWANEMTYFHMSADMRQLLQEEGLDKVHMLGHSMGGKVAARFAMDYPELLRKLTIVDVVPRRYDDETFTLLFLKYIERMKSVPFHKDHHRSLSGARRFADQHLQVLIKEHSVRQFLVLNLINKDGKVTWQLNLDALYKNMDHIRNFPEPLKQFDGETLIISGKNSNYVTEQDINNVRQLFSTLEVSALNGGHWIHSENPIDFVDTVVKFMDKK